MKKYFNLFSIMLFASLAFVFTSCGDDDDDYTPATEDELEGQWVSDWYSYVDEGERYEERSLVDFNSDHSYSMTLEDREEGAIDTETGTWTLRGKTLILQSRDYDFSEFTVYINGDKLKMTYIDEDDNDTETIYFHRR